MNTTVNQLIHIIEQGGDLGEKREAIIALGYENDPAVYPILIKHLDHPSTSLQHAAVISLCRYGNAEAVTELGKSKILRSSNANVRWAAVSTIGNLGDYRVIDTLLKAVEDDEWIVRNQAVTALKQKIRQIAESTDERAFRTLLHLLAQQDREIIELVGDGLLAFGKRSVEPLIAALKSSSSYVRENAARVLGLLKAKQAAKPLIDSLKDVNWHVRKSAVQALGRIGDERAVEPLVLCLRDNVDDVQQQAMKSLVDFGCVSTEPLLNALSHEMSKFVITMILLTLGEIRDPASIPHIVAFSKSSYFVVRNAAVKALIQFGPEVIDYLTRNLSFNQSDISILLRDAANGENQQNQLRAIHALGALEDHRAVNVLKKLVDDGIPGISEAAEKALFDIGTAAWGRSCSLMVLREVGDLSLLPCFIEELQDDSVNVRLEAVRCLGKVDGEKSIEPLVHVARKDPDPYIRAEAIRTLREVGVGYPTVLELALDALIDTDRNVRAEAAGLLGNFQDDRSIPSLLHAMTDSHWSVRQSAEMALQNFADRAVPQLIEALNHEAWTLRLRAARLLGAVGDKRAIEPLKTAYNKKGENQRSLEVIEEAILKLTEGESEA